MKIKFHIKDWLKNHIRNVPMLWLLLSISSVNCFINCLVNNVVFYDIRLSLY